MDSIEVWSNPNWFNSGTNHPADEKGVLSEIRSETWSSGRIEALFAFLCFKFVCVSFAVSRSYLKTNESPWRNWQELTKLRPRLQTSPTRAPALSSGYVTFLQLLVLWKTQRIPFFGRSQLLKHSWKRFAGIWPYLTIAVMEGREKRQQHGGPLSTGSHS